MKISLFIVALWASVAQGAFTCRATTRHPLVEVWTGKFGDAEFTWCVESNSISGIAIYTEFLYGRGVCRGHGCPIRRGKVTATVANQDQVPSPESLLPHGVLLLVGGWRHQRCGLSGTTQADPPLLNDRVAGTITATLACHRGKRVLPAIQFDLTRTQ